MNVDTGGISCCFDEESKRMLKDYRKNGLNQTAMKISETLSKQGLADSTVLEIGCGFGALTLDLLRKGAASATGVDLSAKMLQLAQALAAEAGLSKSVTFRQGDGAVDPLSRSDIVILDTVLCCYPNVTDFVDNSSRAAARYYAISIPDDRRVATRFFRLFLPLQSFIFRRGNFRFFIHPLDPIRARLQAKGFKLVSESHAGWIWSVFVFAAPAPR